MLDKVREIKTKDLLSHQILGHETFSAVEQQGFRPE